MKNKWYEIKNQGSRLQITISGLIEFESSKEFIDMLKEQDVDDIIVRIESPGGSGFDGIAIYNALRMHTARIETVNMGFAASAASVIFMAGDTRTMPEESLLMIHMPETISFGDPESFRETADFLDQSAETIANIYSKNTGVDKDEILTMMSAGKNNLGTTFNANEALEMGFATEVIIESIAACSVEGLNHFKNLPQEAGRFLYNKIDLITNEKDCVEFLTNSGVASKGLAKALVKKIKNVAHDNNAGVEDFNNSLELLNNIQFN